MNQWAFVTAAYGLTLLAMAVMVMWSWFAMRSAEADAMAAKRR